MQTQAVTPNPGRSADSAHGVAAVAKNTASKMLAFGTGESDFLSMLVSRDEKEDVAATEPEPREASRDDRPRSEEYDTSSTASRPETPEPQAAPLQVAEARQDVGRSANKADPQRAEAARPTGSETAPSRDSAQAGRDSQAAKASVEAAAVDSRPRTALAAGASQAAIAAQSEANSPATSQAATQGQAKVEGAGAKTESEQASQRPDFAQMARASAHGKEQAAPGQGNTTMAGLEAMAQGKTAEKGQTTQAPGHQSPSAANALPTQPGQANQAQQVQSLPLVAQVAERTQTNTRTGAPAAGGAGQINALSSASAGAEALPGSAGTGAAVKTETPNAAKPVPNAARVPQPAVDQVSVRIQKAAAAGEDRIQIKLNPAELGRVDVKLEFQTDGGVRAVVSVERPETFDLLQRDARSLERALQDAGFKPGQTNLSFEMQTGGQGQSFADDGAGDGTQGSGRDDAAANPAQQMSEVPSQTDQTLQTRTTSDGRVDLRI
ncbi:flagellar hook-length control protein FliK [Algihabitans albus]|uniref:flagellar hook-length control protein FliK n=1 Tax=Algihabitans albus TaxID=2164067 RepID=UPI000E5D4A59|nr:flagellar hook-length control protein FliK [Algihabitans albus]